MRGVMAASTLAGSRAKSSSSVVVTPTATPPAKTIAGRYDDVRGLVEDDLVARVDGGPDGHVEPLGGRRS